jgi:hypothetical protein
MENYNENAMQGIGMGVGIFYILFLILMAASMWKVFTKAGKPGWAAIVPIYNIIVLLEIVGKPWWWLLLFFIPLVNFVIFIMLFNSLSKSFGKGVGFTVGLLFLGFIFIPILGFGSAEYVGPDGVAPATT